jgi:hypothetical protein
LQSQTGRQFYLLKAKYFGRAGVQAEGLLVSSLPLKPHPGPLAFSLVCLFVCLFVSDKV